LSNLLPAQLNITDKTYNFDDCNPYQKVIYKAMSEKVDELQKLKKLKENPKATGPQLRELQTLLVKGVGVLEFFQSRFERFKGLEEADLAKLSLY